MSKKIAVLGDWHLAFVTAGVLSDRGHKTTLVNTLTYNKTAWTKNPELPVHEPGLREMYDQSISKNNLQFKNISELNEKFDGYWLAIDTPVNEKDEPDLTPLWETLKTVAKTDHGAIVMISSQVPLGFCREVQKTLGFRVSYIPENLRLGKGIETFLKADRTVIGADTEEVKNFTQNVMQNFETQFLLCNLPTAEMIKHANNIFLATSISFANELARVGDGLDVDSHVVATALKQDKRIGPGAYVAPGLGFAGGTLPRDLRVLSQMGKSLKIPTPLVDAVLSVNEMSNDALAQSVLRLTPKNGKVLILGYTYKADTDALRRSPSIELALKLKAQNVELHGFDPFMNGKNISETSALWQHHDKIEDVPRPDVVILMTTRPQFRELSWAPLSSLWQGSGSSGEKPVVFDTQGFLNAEPIVKAGLKYKRLWTSGVQQ